MGDAIGEPGDAQSCQCCGAESRAVVGFEAPLRAHRDCLVAIHELPGFCALHESLMRNEVVRRLGGTMRCDIVRAGDQFSIDGPDVSRDQVGVRKIANPDGAIETFCDEINEAITVDAMDVELRVPSRHVRKHRS